MKKLSLRAFLIIVLTFASIIFLLFFVLLIRDISHTYSLINYSNEFERTYVSWTDARHAQHDFLIKYKDDPVFFQTEQNKYIRRQQIFISDVKLKLDSLSLLRTSDRIDLMNDINLINDNVDQIDKIFSELSHSMFLRGSTKTGVIGNCLSFYELASASEANEQMKSYLNDMYASFLQYLNSPNFVYYQDFLEKFTYLNSEVKQQNISVDTTFGIDTTQLISNSSNVSPEFVNNVNDFKQSFSKLVNLDRNIILNDQANLMTQWHELNYGLGQTFTDAINYVYDYVEQYKVRVRNQIVLFIVLIFSFFVLVNVFLPRIISRRIVELKDFIDPLKSGRIPEIKHEAKAFTEIVEMTEIIGSIVTSLKNASLFAKEIGKGNFNFNYKPVSDQDELGNALILLRDNLEKAQEDEQKRKEDDKIREWFNTGLAKFADTLRQSAKNMSELSAIVIKDLVNYLGANQGGVFMLNDDRKDKNVLELVASYAYSKERKKKKEFMLGEGLIGTCAVEKATIYMTEIPEDYISITSGLGGANPRSLLIVPLKFEEQVMGVIEMASFNKFKQHQIDFVERVAESIASTFSIAKINERTVKLLDNAKLEAEQRSLKEEELRQNLEELQATQERAAQREEELNSLLELINKVAFIIELDVEGNIVSSSDRFAQILGLQNSDIIGHHLSEFDYSGESRLIDTRFWQELLDGKEQRYQLKYLKDNNTLWFNEYIVPFIDKNGDVLKFVCVIIDISEQVEMQEELLEQTNELQIKEQEILKKVSELQSANEVTIKEKKAAEDLMEKIKASEDILKKSLERNNQQIKKIEELAQRSEHQAEQFKLLFEHSSDSIQVMKGLKFIDCNLSTLKMFGYNTIDEFTGVSPADISPKIQPDGKNSIEKAKEMIAIADKEGFNEFEWTHKRLDGSMFQAKITLVSFTRDDELYLYAMVQDISDNYGLKEILLEREEEIAALKKQIEDLKNNKG